MKQTDFLRKIEFFLKRNKITPTKFSKLAVNDPTFVASLYKGRECLDRTKDKVLDFMKNYKTRGA